MTLVKIGDPVESNLSVSSFFFRRGNRPVTEVLMEKKGIILRYHYTPSLFFPIYLGINTRIHNFHRINTEIGSKIDKSGEFLNIAPQQNHREAYLRCTLATLTHKTPQVGEQVIKPVNSSHILIGVSGGRIDRNEEMRTGLKKIASRFLLQVYGIGYHRMLHKGVIAAGIKGDLPQIGVEVGFPAATVYHIHKVPHVKMIVDGFHIRERKILTAAAGPIILSAHNALGIAGVHHHQVQG